MRTSRSLSRRAHAAAVALLAASALAWGCSPGKPVAPVILPPLSAVTLSPKTDTLRVGSADTFTAVALDTNGTPVPGATFTWTTGDPNVFTVNSFGRVTAVSEGTASLYASAGGFTDSASVTVFPDTGWVVQTSHATEDLRGVFFQPDGLNGWVVGDGGVILHTGDGGLNWTRSTPTTFNLNAVWFSPAGEGWAVGNAGTVMYSATGTGWTRVLTTQASEALYGVYFATRDTGWAVGSGGVVMRTFDHGGTWQKSYPTASTLRAVAFAGTRDGWAVGDGGVVLGTHDRGVTWFVVQPSITAQTLRGVWRRSESLAWAVGDQGVAPRTVTTPDSTAWELRNAGASTALQGVCFPTDQIGYAVGMSGVGVVLRTGDGGLSWQVQAPNSQFQLNAVYFVDALHGWVVGNNGTIRHTALGGGS